MFHESRFTHIDYVLRDHIVLKRSSCEMRIAFVALQMMSINKLLLPAQQIIHMCWVNARQSPTRHWQTWKPQFVALKGADLCIFENPPVKLQIPYGLNNSILFTLHLN